MFGWILKTDWDIAKMMEQYAKKIESKAKMASPASSGG